MEMTGRFASIACAMHEHDVEHAQSYLNVLSFIVCEPIWTLVFIWTNIVSIDIPYPLQANFK